MFNNNVLYSKLQKKSKNGVWVEEKRKLYKDRKVHEEDEGGTEKAKVGDWMLLLLSIKNSRF